MKRKINRELILLDILFISLFAYGAYRYVYEVNHRGLLIWLSLLIFPYVAREHYKLYKNRKKIY